MIHTTFGPILINFAPLEVVTKVEVKQMIGLAMDNFAEKQTTEDEGPEVEALLRILIVVEGPDKSEGSCQICSNFLVIICFS